MSKSDVLPQSQEGSRVWCEQLVYELLQDFALVYYKRKSKGDPKSTVRAHFGDKVFFILVGILASNIEGWYDKNFESGHGINVDDDLRSEIKYQSREAIFRSNIIFEKSEMLGLVKKLRLIDNYQDVLISNDVIETVLNDTVRT